jgi:hypothetical protein
MSCGAANLASGLYATRDARLSGSLWKYAARSSGSVSSCFVLPRLAAGLPRSDVRHWGHNGGVLIVSRFVET